MGVYLRYFHLLSFFFFFFFRLAVPAFQPVFLFRVSKGIVEQGHENLWGINPSTDTVMDIWSNNRSR